MSLASDWIARSMSWLHTNDEGAAPPAPREGAAAAPRSLQTRLQATLRRGQEALSPRELRKLLDDLQAASSTSVSEVEGGRLAQAIMQWYEQAAPGARQDAWQLMCEQFGPDGKSLQAARKRYDQASSQAEQGQAEMALRRALVSARTRLLQRFSVPQGGMRFLLQLRADLLALPRSDHRFVALDAELEHLFSTWFDVAFLELRRLSWDSPASVLEKLIEYEAVHDIRSWADLKNRLDSDRRCYGFFHARLPNEPLIFVEVALVESLSSAIAPLLDESQATAEIGRASTAIFYSISNTQAGLRGVSFGDSLIKHVAQTLAQEFPRLKHFATLSPIPGFRAWLNSSSAPLLATLDERQTKALRPVLGLAADAPLNGAALLAAADASGAGIAQWAATAPLRRTLTWCAAHYLGRETRKSRPVDAVARFHLGNGARVERLNWGGDLSAKGLKQSLGLMVNYYYDLKRVDKHRALLEQGQIAVSSDIKALFKP